MLIKIEDIHTVLLSSEELEKDKPNKHRDIGWLCIDAKVYSWAMISRDDVDVQMRENVDHCIVDPPRLAGPNDEPVEMEYDEVCLLTVHDPLQITVLFNTRAYICNDKGDTVEKIVPKRVAKPPIMESFDPKTDKYEGPFRCPQCQEMKDKPGECEMCGHVPTVESVHTGEPYPCLRCHQKAKRLSATVAGGRIEWIGTLHDDPGGPFNCGYQTWK